MDNSNRIISLQDLFKGRNADFDSTSDKEIQLIRHADSRIRKSSKGDSTDLTIGDKTVPPGIANLYELYIYHRDLFYEYQSEQLKGRFDGIKYMVIFLGEKGTTCRFVGVYEIMGRKPKPNKDDEEILELRRIPEFSFLEEKVVIEWGANANAWRQYYYNQKEVIRIEEGLTKTNGTLVFKSYLDVILNFDQLKRVMKDEEWQQKLKQVNCVYLIVDKSTGKKYIGSTYNKEGIYGRWIDYAKDGHGGNVELAALVKKQPNYHEVNFQWTILVTLDYFITQQEAIDKEDLWKRKLMTRTKSLGYNKN